jgi:polyhydroxyalkanoate synthesis regulator phasin
MDDMLKKVINTGVGLLALGNKRVQTALDKLVQDSKLSEQEGQKIMDDLRQTGEAKRKQFEKQVQDLAGNLRSRVGKRGEAAAAEPEAEKPAPKAKAAAKKPAANPAVKAAGAAKKPTAKKPAAATKASAAKDAAEETVE